MTTETLRPQENRATSGFDRIAQVYRWMEYASFGRALERCRESRLPAMAGATRVLVLGDGDGRFTAKLLAQMPLAHVVALDSSPAMLALLAARVTSPSSRLTLIEGDAVRLLEQACALHGYAESTEELDPAGGFDTVCSHFFLDCFSTSEVDRLGVALLPRLAPGARWIVSEFDTPSWWTRSVVALLYRGFRLLTNLRVQKLPEWRPALTRSGFACVAEERRLGGLLTSAIWRCGS